jgi:hypothetical protein
MKKRKTRVTNEHFKTFPFGVNLPCSFDSCPVTFTRPGRKKEQPSIFRLNQTLVAVKALASQG